VTNFFSSGLHGNLFRMLQHDFFQPSGHAPKAVITGAVEAEREAGPNDSSRSFQKAKVLREIGADPLMV
jgi:hypothetical protein